MTISRHKLGVDVTDARDIESPYPVSYCAFCNDAVKTTEIPMLVLQKRGYNDVWSIAHRTCARKTKGYTDPE